MSRRPILSLRVVSTRTAERRIVIEREVFGPSIDVRIQPPCDGPGHDREFRSAGYARAYAQSISAATGWAVLDLAGEDGGA